MTATSMATRCRIVALALLLGATISGVMVGQTRQASPPLGEAYLPESPAQRKPWAAPDTKLPKPLLTATAALFEAGLADPRAGDYRVIRVGTGSCWSGDAGVVETHGWLLPADKNKDRFAVCWNGLVYAVVSFGDKADVQADVLAIVAADDAVRAGRKDFYRFRNANEEGHTVSHKGLLPIRTCMLLRLGEGKLAEKVWTAWTAGMKPNTNDDDVHLKDPYLMLATDWVWARFDRAVCAHMRGDDRLALLDARALVGIKKSVEAEAKARGLVKGDEARGALHYLTPLPALLADQERRAKAPERKPVPQNADKASRIARLIEDLESVAARQWDQPGGVQLDWDETVKALIKEGDAAVEPLVDCLEKDERLTRSVHFWRDFARSRSILGVHEAAYVALAGILETSFFGTASTGDDLTARGKKGREQVAANIRAYWKRFKEVPLEERWYQTLKDDKLARGPWLQAAGNITQRVDVHVGRGSMFGTGWTTVPDRKPDAKPALRGEVLRKKNDPSVTALLIKRIESIRQDGAPGSEQFWAIGDACRLAYDLAKWDPVASLPVLTKMVKVSRAYIAGDRNGNTESLGPAIATMTRLRLRAGDANALADYADWIRTLEPKGASHSWRDMLRPMWENPDHPAVAAAAEAMFHKAGSPWTKKFLCDFNTRDLFDTPMLGLVGFRKRLLLELGDQQRAGKMDLIADRLELDGGGSGGPAFDLKGDPLAPPPGTKEVVFRVCDYYACHLSRLMGFPRCELYWPEADRDKAVAACGAFLIKYAARFKYSATLSPALEDWHRTDQATPIFPRRDYPATSKEARAGAAIFAFEPEEEPRVWKLPDFPMKARWVTLKDFPYEQQYFDPKAGKGGTRTKYYQDGWVWQAEEVLKDGKWQRYYGFVGKYVLAKVNADQIEFPPKEVYPQWSELQGGIDCRVLGPDVKSDKDGKTTAVLLGVGDPLIVRVQLRNRAGLDRPIPAEFVRPDPKNGSSLHIGIQPQLARADAKKPGPAAHEDDNWTELTPKATPHFKAGPARKTAAPAEVFAEFAFDLNDWFNITQPRRYRVQLIFSNRDGGFADGSSWEVQFQLAASAPK